MNNYFQYSMKSLVTWRPKEMDLRGGLKDKTRDKWKNAARKKPSSPEWKICKRDWQNTSKTTMSKEKEIHP